MSQVVCHLTSSTFVGGPERQMLGMARALSPHRYRTVFMSFGENGGCRSFLDACREHDFPAEMIAYDTPRFRAAVRDIEEKLRANRVDLLFCHGYKAGLLGRIAARRQRLPVVGVSRGWTYENLKVNVYEFLDRLNLRLMDHVVCVSQAQARKVMRCGVPSRLVSVIPDSVDVKRFGRAAIGARTRVLQFFETPPRWIVGAIGRLSPEKGFDDFVRAARAISAEIENVGFLIIGEGKTRSALERLIAELGMRGRVVLTGFRNDIDELLPALDVMVQSSHTEGMPNVVLEACAACVPVVATRVGGTSEIILDGQTGRLVPPGEPEMVAAAVRDALHDYGLHVGLAIEGRSRVESSFTFDAQAEAYSALVEALAHGSRSHEPDLPAVANSHTGGVIAHGPVR